MLDETKAASILFALTLIIKLKSLNFFMRREDLIEFVYIYLHIFRFVNVVLIEFIFHTEQGN